MVKKNRIQNNQVTHPVPVLILISILLLAVCVGSGCIAPQSATDPARMTTPPVTSPKTTVHPVTQPQNLTVPVQRIIVTNADAAEMLLALGAQDRIVGVSDTVKNHPVLGPRFTGIESIGSWQAPDIEKIIALNPDAVISYSTYLPKNVDKITASEIPLYTIDCYKIDTLASDTRQLGRLTGKEQAAENYIAFLERYETLVQSRVKNIRDRESPRVYFESYADYSALTMGSGGDLLVTMAGGSNIAGLLPVASPKVNAEWVYAENPDVIIKVAASGKNVTELREIREKITGRTGIANTSAVRNGQVFVLSSSIVYGPRSVIGLVYIAKILHPDEFRDVQPAGILDEYAGTFVARANTTPVFSTPAV